MRPGIPRFPWLKVAAACVALGLHAAVLAMVLTSPVATVAPGQPDALDVQFIELSPAPAAETREPAPVAQPPELAAAEPEMSGSVPGPAFEPIPHEVQQPEPEAPVEPRPPVNTPKPKPVVRHRPSAKPRPRVPKQPVRMAAAPAHVEGAVAAVSNQAVAAQGAPKASAPLQPRVVGQVDYLGPRPTPVYPQQSERRGEQGRVILRVLISPEGHVAGVKVQKSSGYARLDQAAIDAIRKARFRPYTENGVAYPAQVDIPFDFVL
ncbi:MAG TPA: energy transducer TonB [Castellaniella sp.]|uniref:energy transducer TonB n=1 Tax=Castellaniella sp. TaxID=1955812 RepID=UPI002F079D1C